MEPTPESIAREIKQKREQAGTADKVPGKLAFSLGPYTEAQQNAMSWRARSLSDTMRAVNAKPVENSILQARGARYANCRLSNYTIYNDAQTPVKDALIDYCREMAANIRSGVGIVLFGPRGTGKDHLATACAFAAVKAGFGVRWENGMDLFGDFRDAMDTDTPEKSIVRSLIRPDVLVLSDPVPPKGDLTDYQTSTLFRIVDGRYNEMKPTWVTLNCSAGPEAAARMGAQTVDRLRHGSLHLWCDWPSYRERKA